MPLGSGAIAGTAYDIDVHFLAQRLGFSRIVANSIDTSGDRDFVATFLYACAMTMVHLSRLAEDVILLSSEEFGFLEVHDSVATGSSLMPQKKNPDPLELVRGKAGKAVGLLTGWLTTLKGLAARVQQGSAGRQGDRRSRRRTWSPPACRHPRRSCARSASVPDVARRAASGLLLATEVADYLVGRGLPFRTAHEVTGRIVRDLYESGKDFSALSLDGLAALPRGVRRRDLQGDHARSGRRRATHAAIHLPRGCRRAACGDARLAGAAAHRAFVKGGGHGRRGIR